MLKTKFSIIKVAKFFLLLFAFGLSINTATSQNDDCTKAANFLYLVDCSGSIDATDWRGMRRTINLSIPAIKSHYPGSLFSIVHMQYNGGTSHVQYDFTPNPSPLGGKLGGYNDPATSFGGLAKEISDNDGFLEGDRSNPLTVIYFTDGHSEHTPYSGRNQLMTKALQLYPAAHIVVVQITGGASNSGPPATASVGGSYNGPVASNPGDPQGSGTKPRMYVYRNSFGGNINSLLLGALPPPCPPCSDATVIISNIEEDECPSDIVSDILIYNGEFPIPVGTGITFYDGDPRVAGATKLGTYTTTVEIAANATERLLDVPVGACVLTGDFLYVVLGDDGSNAMPLDLSKELANPTYEECDYTDNISVLKLKKPCSHFEKVVRRE